MAKKKGKREEGFTFPKFDGEEYRVKEVRDSKVTLFAVLYAIVVSVICYLLVKMADVGACPSIHLRLLVSIGCMILFSEDFQ